jgi:hypothetical protein
MRSQVRLLRAASHIHEKDVTVDIARFEIMFPFCWVRGARFLHFDPDASGPKIGPLSQERTDYSARFRNQCTPIASAATM